LLGRAPLGVAVVVEAIDNRDSADASDRSAAGEAAGLNP
jgi:hypothetical protein